MADGSLIFAGDGFNRIFPDRIKIDTFVPQLLITNLKLHNKDVLINGPDSVLHQNINVTKEITLQYKQNVITLEYAALDMVHADKRQYAYRLVGFDPDWQYVDKKREVTYTNLAPGTYIFKVKSSTDEENWSEIQNPLMITILPPWYRTWWAYGIYLLMISYAGWKLHRYQKAKTIKKEREKAQERELEHAKEIELAYTKLGTAHENLKSSQAQLIQSEKMASLGQLTAGIAHEIQNPLNFVNNFSEVNNELLVELKDEIKKGNLDEVNAIADDVISNEQKINEHGKRAANIVKGMLQHSRTSSGKKELTDINKLADEYLRLAYHGLRAKDKTFNAELITNFDPNLPKIEVIPQDIGRVILNLITNAFYAVNEKANLLNLEKQSSNANLTDLAYGPKVTVTTQLSANSQLLIAIKDNGSGIPEHIKDKILQPFFTTKPTGQGTGLGLSLAYDIVKAHGGELKVESKEGEGSEFIIKLSI
jgi:signal transduction histidine kinase